MGAWAELIDAWADLVHGGACVGCAMPGRPWCRSCSSMLGAGLEPRKIDVGVPTVLGACMGEYDDWLKTMILAHKERSAWSLVEPLGHLLAQSVWSLADRGGWGNEGIVLVPIPSRRSTVRRRGHNPSLQMTKAAAAHLRSLGIRAQALPILRLRLPVKDSVGLSAAARRRNLEDAFAVQRCAQAALARLGTPVRIVICDDVMTTGVTVREAGSALELAGFPVSGIATVAAVRRTG